MVHLFGQLNGSKLTVESIVYQDSSLSDADKEKGCQVDNPPQEIPVEGKSVSATYYDTQSKTYSFDYVDKPVTQEDVIQQLKATQAQALLDRSETNQTLSDFMAYVCSTVPELQ